MKKLLTFLFVLCLTASFAQAEYALNPPDPSVDLSLYTHVMATSSTLEKEVRARVYEENNKIAPVNDNASINTGDKYLYLQSHWGSGVIYAIKEILPSSSTRKGVTNDAQFHFFHGSNIRKYGVRSG